MSAPPSSAQAPRQTLEAIISRFRREVGHGATPELEVRVQDVDSHSFLAIFKGLSAAGTPGVVSQVVTTLMDQPRRGAAAVESRGLVAARVREIHFREGRKHEEKYRVKTPLVPAYRVPSSVGLSYIVALADEKEERLGFNSDESAVIRVKARVSFAVTLPGTAETRPALEWRVDLTVARQIMGSDAPSALAGIVDQMFRTQPPMTAANFAGVLRLADEAAARLYRYEVEAEFAGDAEVRDLVRPADVTAVADHVLQLANAEHAQEAALAAAIHRAAERIVGPAAAQAFRHGAGLKRLLPQATAVTRATYREIYPPTGYFLTDKADGRRALGAVLDGRGLVISDRVVPGGASSAGDTLVDGEWVAATAEAPGTLYVFDAICVGGEDIAADPFEKRVGRIDEAVAILVAAGVPAAAKPYRHLAGATPAELRPEISAVAAAPRPYEVDGLIFVAPGASYLETRTEKWKPAEHNTIDFYARRAPRTLLGKPPYVDRPGARLHLLFVGVNEDTYAALNLRRCPGYGDLFPSEGAAGRARGAHFPIQFAPPDAPYAYLYWHPDDSPLGAEIDGLIVEGRRVDEAAATGGADGVESFIGVDEIGQGPISCSWEMTRRRDDHPPDLVGRRYFGNDYRVAEMVWLNYLDPFPLEQLWEGAAGGYFAAAKGDTYRAQTAFVSFVKTQRIGALAHANSVVDLGAGNGQDLGRYIDAQVQNLLAVDRDRGALAELVRRRYSHGANRRRSSTTIRVLVADAGAPAEETAAKFRRLGVAGDADAVVCNLALHYLLGSDAGLRNAVALIASTVKVGGQAIVTCLLGDRVHAAFVAAGTKEGATYDIVEADVVKYSLRRMYRAARLTAAGQKIGVLLPFSSGEYYEEYLVNPDALAAEFAAHHFAQVVRAPLDGYLRDFEAHNPPVARRLTPADRQWVALYGEMVFRREK